MSCKGNLITEDYTKKTVEMAEANHEDLVMGFICQRKLSDVPGLIHMTPGVNLHVKGDALGQQYNVPSTPGYFQRIETICRFASGLIKK